MPNRELILEMNSEQTNLARTGVSDASNAATIVVAGDTLAPSSPTSVTANSVPDGVKLEWLNPSLNEDGTTCVDQRWSKIFKVAENAYMGCVDGSIGYHKPSPTKPVMLTVVVDDPDAWYSHFQKHGVKTLNEPHDDKKLNLRIFLLEDPEGYVIEIQKFY